MFTEGTLFVLGPNVTGFGLIEQVAEVELGVQVNVTVIELLVRLYIPRGSEPLPPFAAKTISLPSKWVCSGS
jgi:hypothetical protein